jgi:pSer/pThr/pTyr-binding forkhead associated (FHA) protein
VGISPRPSKYASKRGAKRTGKGEALARKGFILTVTDGQQIGKEYFFDQQATIGRVEGCDIVLVEPGISRSHARVYDDQGVYLVQDNGSANGTRLNGEKVSGEPEVLRDGDYLDRKSVV